MTETEAAPAGTKIDLSDREFGDIYSLTVEEKDASIVTNGSILSSSATSAGKQVGMILDIDKILL